MLWKDEENLHIQMFFPTHMDAIILFVLKSPLRITSFYGHSKECRKQEFWILLRHLHSHMSLPSMGMYWRL